MKARVALILVGGIIWCAPALAEKHSHEWDFARHVLKHGHISLANEMISQGLKKNSSCAELHYFRGCLRASENQYLEALSDQSQAIELAKNNLLKSKAYLSRALLNAALNRVVEAENDFKKALEFGPDFDEANLEYGNFLARTNRAEEAEPHLEKASNPSKETLAEARFYDIDQILKQNRTEDFLKEASEHIVLNDSKAAIKILNKGIERFPNNVEMYSVRGPLLAQQKNYGAAIKDYDKVIELAPRRSEFIKAGAYLNKALLEKLNKKYQDADTNFKLAVLTDPWHSISYIEYGQFLIEQKRSLEALSYLEKAKILLYGHGPKSIIDRLEVLLTKANRISEQEFDKAMAVLNQGIGKQPKCGELYQLRAELLSQYKKSSEAFTDIEKAIEFAKDNRSKALAFCSKAVTASLLYRRPEAEDDFKKSIELDSEIYQSNFEYGKFLFYSNSMPEAVIFLEKAKSLMTDCKVTDKLEEIDKFLQIARRKDK